MLSPVISGDHCYLGIARSKLLRLWRLETIPTYPGKVSVEIMEKKGVLYYYQSLGKHLIFLHTTCREMRCTAFHTSFKKRKEKKSFPCSK